MPSSAYGPVGQPQDHQVTRELPTTDQLEGHQLQFPGPPREPVTPSGPRPRNKVLPRRWLVAMIAGLGGYAATVIATAAAALLFLAGVALSGGPSENQEFRELSRDLDASTAAHGLWSTVGLLFQVSAMAFLSPLRLVVGGNGGPSLGAILPLYLPLACGFAMSWLLARKLGAPLSAGRRGVQWAMAAVAGLTWAVVATAATVLTVVSLDVPLPVVSVTLALRVTGVGPALFLVAFLSGLLSVAGALNTRVCRSSAPSPAATAVERLVPGLRQVLRPLMVHVAVFTVPAGVLILILAMVEGGSMAGFSAPFWWPVALGWSFVLSHLSALQVVDPQELLSDISGSHDVVYLWNHGGLPWWTVLPFITCGLLAVACAALSWSLVRPVDERVARARQSWMVLPLVYLVLGALLTWGLTAAGHVSGSVLGLSLQGSTTVRPVAWTCLVLALWGALIEVLARWVVPGVLPALPSVFRRVLRGPDPARGREAVMTEEETAPLFADPTGEGEPRGSGTATARPVSKKRKRLAALVLGVLALLALVAASAFWMLHRTALGPDHKAQEFFDAVVSGNAQRAVELADPNVPTEQRGPLSTDIYTAAQNRISSYSIRNTSVMGDRATVEADIVQDGVTTPVTVNLVADGRDGLSKAWRLRDTQPNLYQDMEMVVPAGVQQLTVNNQKVPIAPEAQEHSITLTALPGDYQVGVDSQSKYLTYGDAQTAQVTVHELSAANTVKFSAEHTPALEKEVTQIAHDRLNECAASREFDPEGCPFGASFYEKNKEYRAPRWTMVEYPAYEVSGVGNRWFVGTSAPGRVTLDYQFNVQWNDNKPADWEDHDTNYSVLHSGDLIIDGDTVEVRWSH